MDEQMIEDIARIIDPNAFTVHKSPFDGQFVTALENCREAARVKARAAHSVMAARLAELMGLIRECRLADAYAARTGDELRWDRAFHDLCRAERRAALAPHPKGTDQ